MRRTFIGLLCLFPVIAGCDGFDETAQSSPSPTTSATSASSTTDADAFGSSSADSSTSGGASMASVAKSLFQAEPKLDKATMDKMKAIGLAFHRFHDANQALPPAKFPRSSNGEYLFSWRVYLLPYLNEQALFNQFHLDEPWDSEHNLKVAAQVPQCYVDPNRPLSDPTKTTFVAPQGENAGYVGSGEPLTFREFTDGTSNTVALLNVLPQDSVTWSKPEEWQYDPANPLRGLDNQNSAGQFFAMTLDGYCRIYSAKKVGPVNMRSLIERNDGQRIPNF